MENILSNYIRNNQFDVPLYNFLLGIGDSNTLTSEEIEEAILKYDPSVPDIIKIAKYALQNNISSHLLAVTRSGRIVSTQDVLQGFVSQEEKPDFFAHDFVMGMTNESPISPSQTRANDLDLVNKFMDGFFGCMSGFDKSKIVFANRISVDVVFSIPLKFDINLNSLFCNLTADEWCPFIRFNDGNDGRKTLVFDRSRYRGSITPSPPLISRNDTLYVNLRRSITTPKRSRDFNLGTVTISYDGNTPSIRIRVPVTDESDVPLVTDRINHVFKKFGRASIIDRRSVIYEYGYHGMVYYPDAMYFYTRTDPFAVKLWSSDERKTLYPDKQKFSYNMRVMVGDKDVRLGRVIFSNVSEGVVVNIKAIDDSSRHFIAAMTGHMLTRHTKHIMFNETPFIDRKRQIISGELEHGKVRAITSALTYLDSHYGSSCQCFKQPIIIPPIMHDLIKDMTFTMTMGDRKISIPVHREGDVMMICPANNKIMGIQHTGRNKEIQAPCCTKTGKRALSRPYEKYTVIDVEVPRPGKQNKMKNVGVVEKCKINPVLLNSAEAEFIGVTEGIFNIILAVDMALEQISDVKMLRSQLRLIDPLIIKQELFDFTSEEIAAMLNDLSTIIDPYIFVKAIEHLFQVHIFCFEMDESDVLQLAPPRYKGLFIREPKYSRGVMLKINRRIIGYPVHCEVLVVNGIRVLNEFMVEALLMHERRSTFSCISSEKGIITYRPPFFNEEKVSFQVIDQYGKCVAIIYDGFFIAVPPMEPMNITSSFSKPNRTVEDAVRYFGQPIHVTDMGLWYPHLGMRKGFHVNVSGTHGMVFTAQAPAVSYFMRNDQSSLDKHERQAKLLQIYIFNALRASGLDIDRFFEKHVEVLEDEDEIQDYPEPIYHDKFPRFINPDDLFSFMEFTWPDIIRNSIFHLNRELSSRLYEWLKTTDHIIEFVDTRSIIWQLMSNKSGYYHTEAEYMSWVNSVSDVVIQSVPSYTVSTTGAFLSLLPNIFSKPLHIFKSGKNFMIQAVFMWRYDMAVAVSNYWIKTKTNPGPLLLPDTVRHFQTDKVTLFKIHPTEVIEHVSGNYPVLVLQIDSSHFAAMLLL